MVFEVQGKFAHFKKFYTNSSSLTYVFPPRTVIAGMLASMLKIKRDKYYSIFNTKNSKITVSLKTPIRKHIECLNYRKKDGTYTQTRLELLMPLKEKTLKYRIYFFHEDEDVYFQVKEKIKKNNYGYGLYFGQKPFLAYISLVEEINQIKEIENITEIDSVIRKNNVKKLKEQEYFEELQTINFNKEREAIKTEKIISGNGRKLLGIFKKGYVIKYKNDKSEIIDFIE